MKERRSLESRRGGDARSDRNYDAARRRIDGLEKALVLIVGSLTPKTHELDQGKLGDFRLGIDIARSLLTGRLAAAGATAGGVRADGKLP